MTNMSQSNMKFFKATVSAGGINSQILICGAESVRTCSEKVLILNDGIDIQFPQGEFKDVEQIDQLPWNQVEKETNPFNAEELQKYSFKGHADKIMKEVEQQRPQRGRTIHQSL